MSAGRAPGDGGGGREVAIVDGASFVAPYVNGLASALAASGRHVAVFASATRWNPEFLDALEAVPGVRVVRRAVSGSVAPRWRGVPAYAALLARLWRERRRFAVVNLQFSVLWPLEWALFRLSPALRRRFVFTVHNAVPHGFAGRVHAPTARLAALARRLVFASDAVRDDFLARYGERFAARAGVLRHGTLPAAPGLPPRPYRAGRPVEAAVFWGNVAPYKGVELFEALGHHAGGLPLEVHGRWDPALAPLKARLEAAGVRVEDRFLDGAALAALLARDLVFVLPYRAASQSGALYTLLHHGARFVCADTGDLGRLLRRAGLEALLFAPGDAAGAAAAITRLQADDATLTPRLQAAQAAHAWARVLAEAPAAYAELPD